MEAFDVIGPFICLAFSAFVIVKTIIILQHKVEEKAKEKEKNKKN